MSNIKNKEEAASKIASKIAAAEIAIEKAKSILSEAAAIADEFELDFSYNTPFGDSGRLSYYVAKGSDLDKEWNSSSNVCSDEGRFLGWVSSSDLCY